MTVSKKGSIVLLVLLLVSCFINCYGAEETIYGFDSYKIGVSVFDNTVTGFKAGNPGNGEVKIETFPNGSGNALLIRDTNSESGGTNATLTLPKAMEGVYAVEMEVVTDSTLYIQYRNAANGVIADFRFINEGNVRLVTDTLGGSYVDFISGYNFKGKNLTNKITMEFNTIKKTYDVYWTASDLKGLSASGPGTVDDSVYILKDVPIVANITDTQLRNIIMTKSHGAGDTYIKEIGLAVFSAPEVSNVTVTDIRGNITLGNAVTASPDITEISVEFDCDSNGIMDAESLGNIGLADASGNGISPESVEYDQDNNIYRMKLDTALASGTEYGLLIPETVQDSRGLAVTGYQTQMITTGRNRIEATPAVYSEDRETGISARTEVTNYADAETGVCLVLAYFDEHGALLDLVMKNSEPLPAGQTKTVLVSGLQAGEGGTVKAYLWEKAEAFTPLYAFDSMVR